MNWSTYWTIYLQVVLALPIVWLLFRAMGGGFWAPFTTRLQTIAYHFRRGLTAEKKDGEKVL
jgi:hypothetical protein